MNTVLGWYSLGLVIISAICIIADDDTSSITRVGVVLVDIPMVIYVV